MCLTCFLERITMKVIELMKIYSKKSNQITVNKMKKSWQKIFRTSSDSPKLSTPTFNILRGFSFNSKNQFKKSQAFFDEFII